ncbi:RkpR, polysaccharide export protein [Roseibium sp. SCP14]|uniref:RkpR, polysaccharide export protein n=1 Tax=Roseibium sp. SCP14 TaxID=3141375 RepID=UPI00333D1F8D
MNRLKKSGLDPQKLLDLALPDAQTAKRDLRARHNVIRVSLVLFVIIPSLFFTAYMFFVASDQYHSTVAFAVRSSNSSPATEILGMVLDSGGDSVTSNSYIVHDYLQSQTVVEEIGSVQDLDSVFNRSGSDWLFSMGNDLPVEDKLSYWKRMVDVDFDATSGVIFVEVRTFDAEDSVKLASEILNRSETLVNKLSEANRRQSVRFAEEAVARAETRLKAIRRQLLQYREQTQEVSPEDNARISMEKIAGLDKRVSEKEAERETLLSYLDENSPRIRILSEEISALRSQIAVARAQLGAGSSAGDVSENGNPLSNRSISFRIADYSDLKLEEEFANQLFVTALASLEQARQDADARHMYLATFITPTLSEDAQYPSRLFYSLAVFLLLAGAWTVVVLMYYNIRDRN